MVGRRSLILGGAAFAFIPTQVFSQTSCSGLGKFSAPITVQLLDDGRSIRVMQPITYTARCGRKWQVPVGAVSDGASIPGFLWKIVGSPLIGKYRNAAVVHDYYCSVRTEDHIAVHRMFHEAMLASGVSAYEAMKFYLGVRIGGPTWDEITIANARVAAGQAAAAGSSHTVSVGGVSVPVFPSLPSSGANSGNLNRTDVISDAALVIERNNAAVDELARMMTKLPVETAQFASAEALDRYAERYRINVEQERLATSRIERGVNAPVPSASTSPSSINAAAPQSSSAFGTDKTSVGPGP